MGSMKVGGNLDLSGKVGKDLLLHDNQLTSLPESMGSIQVDRDLILSHNQLTSLDPTLIDTRSHLLLVPTHTLAVNFTCNYFLTHRCMRGVRTAGAGCGQPGACPRRARPARPGPAQSSSSKPREPSGLVHVRLGLLHELLEILSLIHISEPTRPY